MSNFSSLKAAIQQYIKTNGNEEITGAVLQDILLSMVSVLGDGAINDLVAALAAEVTNRQNADGTLQTNINNETTQRSNADTALGGRIDGVVSSINTINTKLAEGYVYAGIATTSTNPGTPIGKVLYIATEEGEYTNFGLTVFRGLNLLMYNGLVWSHELVYGVTDEQLYQSESLITSGGVYPIKQSVSKPTYSAALVATVDEGKRVLHGGAIGSLAAAAIFKYPVTAKKIYAISALYGQSFVLDIVNWFDANGNFISQELVSGSNTGNTRLVNVEVEAPLGAAFLYVNVHYSYAPDFTSVKEVLSRQYIQYDDILQKIKTNSPVSLYSKLTTIGYSQIRNGYVRSNGTIISTASFKHYIYPVFKGNKYQVKSFFTNATRAAIAVFSSDLPSVGQAYTTLSAFGLSEVGNEIYLAECPSDGYLIVNCYQGDHKPDVCVAEEDIQSKYLDNRMLIKASVGLATMQPVETLQEIDYNVGYVRPNGTILNSASYRYLRYNLIEGLTYRLFSGMSNSTVFNEWLVVEEGSAPFTVKETSSEFQEASGDEVYYLTPKNSGILIVNTRSYVPRDIIKLEEVELLINNLDNFVDERINSVKTMKVVVNSMSIGVTDVFNNEDSEKVLFYIRTKYNDSKDIIITHWENGNTLISFARTYIGDKRLSDEKLMTSTYLVSEHTDSTSPIYRTDGYWYLFAQHGYIIPRINNPGMTSSDVGAVWKDQLNRQYTIGLVDSSKVYLLPVIYQSGGHYTRDWESYNNSDAITSLTHVSGGTYTSDITVSGYYRNQLRPIMSNSNREWYADGQKITKEGTYYCDTFKVSESAIGYDPATISDWFGNTGNNVKLTGALPMCQFTFSYNYCGAQCCVNTTIDVRREVKCYMYGATQQQFFVDNGSYKAMFIIPKAKTNDGVELDKPFNSPSLESNGHMIYRTSDYLKDVDDPVDRQIGYLYNPNDGTYLVGMAAGLSLVSGDTVKSKRIQNCPVGDGGRNLLLNFSPGNSNKFYIAAFNSAKYADNGYYLPDNLFREVNYYISYFDPAENVGQVYWYKDGNEYIIYCHCQSVRDRLAINVPECMEGLSLSVVEKTTNTDLLTDTIQNGKFFVNYNTADANYIVLKAE